MGSFKNGDNFAGLFQNSRKSGYGFYHWADGALEEGEYVKGKKHGWHRWRRGRDGWDLHYAHGTLIEAWRNQVTEEELQEDLEAEIIADPVLEPVKSESVVDRTEEAEDEDAEIEGEGATFDLARALRRISKASAPGVENLPDPDDPDEETDFGMTSAGEEGAPPAPRKLSKEERRRSSIEREARFK